MAISESPVWVNDSTNLTFTPEEWTQERRYRCHIALVTDGDDGISAFVLNLPGAVSQGDTEEEAVENIRESVSGVIESFLADNEPIPWMSEDAYRKKIPSGAKLKWILVHV